MHDIIAIGDATLDVFLVINEVQVKCTLDTEKCEICFNYADKIPVESMQKVNGAGNASNNAVGSSRLGLNAAIFSILGDDETGKWILKHWKDEGIHVRHVSFDRKKGTNYSTVLNFKGERTILVYHEPRNYRLPADLPKSKWVYYTSLGKGSEVMHGPLLKYCHKTKSKLVFQPGTFQLKLGTEALRPMLAASEIVFVNKEEAEQLVGDSTRDMKVLLARLRALGCEIAVITDGPLGSYAFDGSKNLFCDIMDVPAVERTGCGDAYATAFTAALAKGLPIEEAMRWGSANSASVLGYVGPQAGLLTSAQMKKWLKKFSGVRPSLI
jgi:ribokinase